MRDRRAEGRLALRAVGVHVDPLLVAGGFGEQVDALLRHLEPVRGAELLPDPITECLHVGNDEGFGHAELFGAGGASIATGRRFARSSYRLARHRADLEPAFERGLPAHHLRARDAHRRVRPEAPHEERALVGFDVGDVGDGERAVLRPGLEEHARARRHFESELASDGAGEAFDGGLRLTDPVARRREPRLPQQA